MNLKYSVIKLFTFYFLLFTFTGCGYKPSSYYAKSEMSGKVYVDLHIDMQNPRNSVLIKDAMNEILLTKFGAKVAKNKQEADTQVVVSLGSVSHSVISSDNLGYAKTYRATVTIQLNYQKNGEQKRNLSVSNYYDYSVESNSLVSDQQKQEAVKNAALKALDDIFSKIAINSFKG